MVLLLHGAAGGWDELAIAAIGLAVLWVAVKLAARKPATSDDDENDEAVDSANEEHADPAPPPAAKVG